MKKNKGLDEIKIQEKTDIFESIKFEIEKNVVLLKQMQEELPKLIRFSSLDTCAWKTLSNEKPELIDNFDFMNNLNHIYSEFQHIQSKLDALSQMSNKEFKVKPNRKEESEKMSDSILVNIRAVLPKCIEVLDEIESELSSLSLIHL